jgi:hypothetical protein
MNYLTVNVYRRAGPDCTNNGATSNTNTTFVVPVTDGHITSDQVEESGFVILTPGELGGQTNLSPMGLVGHQMFGGNFVYSCDSRFSRTYGHSPVAVHDRVEGSDLASDPTKPAYIIKMEA